MYNSFVSANLREYYKIIDVINSCQNEDQFAVASKCFETFLANCDHRLDALTRYRNIHPFKLSNWSNVKKYDAHTREQIGEIKERAEIWAQAYKEFLECERVKKEEKKNKPPKPKKVHGFNKLF